MKESYDLNQLALITGFTTRTLRNHMKLGLLRGEKVNGAWAFSDEEVDAFLSDPGIRQALRAKRHAAVLDFLSDTGKKENRACVILDFPVEEEESRAISDFFCGEINRHGEDLEFRFGRDRGLTRVILAGGEDAVMDLVRSYYDANE